VRGAAWRSLVTAACQIDGFVWGDAGSAVGCRLIERPAGGRREASGTPLRTLGDTGFRVGHLTGFIAGYGRESLYLGHLYLSAPHSHGDV